MLRRELIRPIQTYTNRTLITAILIAGGGLAAGLAMMAAPICPAPAPPAPAATTAASAPRALVVSVPVFVPIPSPAASPRASELAMVVEAGGATYLQLASLASSDPAAEVMPKHGKLRHAHDDETSVDTAIASVAERDVPAAHRGWKGREVVLDTGCTAKVTGFAVVAQLTGQPSYAPEDLEAWSAKAVMAHGSVMLAAKLDGCATATYARDATLPAVVIPEPIEDTALVDAARAKLIASSAARAEQAEWLAAWPAATGDWHAHARFESIVVRHPGTGVTWVSVHANSDFGCGGSDFNLWGLFRVEPDGSLATAQLRDLGELHAVKQLIDIEGDGELEVIGAPWLGLDRVIVRPGGAEVARLDLPFFGCPC